MAKKKIINASNFTLNQWLKLLFNDRESVRPNNYFPNELAKDEYIRKIKKTPENKVKDLLRILLPRTGYNPMDFIIYNALKSSLGEKKFNKLIESNERWKKIALNRYDVWEGLTWVLDLLPHHPGKAIQTLETYFIAQLPNMSDDQIWSNDDCIDIITAKFYDLEHPKTLLQTLDPIEFEWLVESLYIERGYSTELTKRSNDQGIDIIALRNDLGKKEKTLIQCKRHNKTIGSAYIRDLLGIVTSKKATKGVLIATSEFSREAIKFANENPSIELIGFKSLTHLLNKYLGTKWPQRMRIIFRNKQKELYELTK